MVAASSAAACGAVVCASGADASASAISGIVRSPQGQAVAGAQVELNAFALDKAGVHEISIESTTSSSSGRYVLPAPSASQTASLAKVDGGTINYEVDVTSVSDGVVQSATTTVPGSAAFGAAASARLAAGLSASGGIDLTLTTLHEAGGRIAHASISPRDCTDNSPSWNTVSTGSYQVIMGEPHDYIGMSVQYAYEQDASTTIGIALSGNGGSTWGENGSASTTTTSGVGFSTPWSPDHYAPYVYGTFIYDRQQEDFRCTGPSDTYRVVPDYWTGGVNVSGNLTAYDGGNSPVWQHDQALGGAGEAFISAGVTWHKSGGSGATYGAGANFAGVSLSANTSYSTSVTYTWQMDNDTSIPHVLFGANGVYPATGGGATIVYSN
jgi:hypothetical protein